MISTYRRLAIHVAIFTSLLSSGILARSVQAAFTVVRTYDSADTSNFVDTSATSLTVVGFTRNVATAFDQGRGGVVNFDSGSFDVQNQLVANYGTNRSVTILKGAGGTGNWSRATILNGGISGPSNAQGVLFGGASNFIFGAVINPLTGLPLSERVTQFGITIIDRADQQLPISVTASYFNYVTNTLGSLPTVNTTIPIGTSNQNDTFFGFAAPANSYLTQVHFTSTSGGIAHDDLGFITSTVPEPGTWAMLLSGLLFAGLRMVRIGKPQSGSTRSTT